jgi:Sap, sulfolipid-1-addressing protein
VRTTVYPSAGRRRAEIGDVVEQVLAQLVPLAVAAALSSVPLTATIFILLSDSSGRSGLAFLAGTVLGTFAAVTVATVASQALPGRPRQHQALIGKLEIAMGIAMVLLGVVTLMRRQSAGRGSGAGWLDDIGSFGSLPVLGIGLALNLRPKAVLLAAAAGLATSGARLELRETLVLLVCYTTIATCTVVVPIVATILFPQRMKPRLVSAKGWLAAHSTAVSATISMMIGGFLIAVGVRG